MAENTSYLYPYIFPHKSVYGYTLVETSANCLRQLPPPIKRQGVGRTPFFINFIYNIVLYITL